MTSRSLPAARTGAAAAAAAVLVGVLGGVLGACGPGEPPPAREGEVAGPVVVFAAATLTGVFTAIGAEFEAAHPGTEVVLHVAGSSTLAQQLNEGAPADVFASAHPDPMAAVAAGGVTSVAPVTFARADLVIVVAAGNPHGITGLADLARPGVSVALCAEQVPCGQAAARALAAGGVQLTPVSYERDVRAALSKVQLGEVDAALVYRADAHQAGPAVAAVEFPEAAGAVNELQITLLGTAPNPVAAEAFVAQVRSPAGWAVLAAAGYLEPE